MSGLRFLRVIVFAFACGFAAMSGFARADDVTASLTQASKMMQAGVYVRAIEIITAALSSNKVPAELAAKALLMRAQANEKLGKPAFALADYNQAVWMQGLSASDKKVAEEGRLRVQGSLGVKDVPEDDAGEAGSGRQASAAAPQQESSGGGGGFFSNIFGSSQSAKKEEKPQHAVVAVVQQEPPAAKPAPRARPAATAPVRHVAANTGQPTANPAANSGSGEPGGDFAIQFAALLNEDGAISEVNRIAKKFGGDLGGRSPSVVIVPTKDGGTLYKILAGPYDKAEGQATCELLKTKNLSCMVISRRQ